MDNNKIKNQHPPFSFAVDTFWVEVCVGFIDDGKAFVACSYTVYLFLLGPSRTVSLKGLFQIYKNYVEVPLKSEFIYVLIAVEI